MTARALALASIIAALVVGATAGPVSPQSDSTKGAGEDSAVTAQTAEPAEPTEPGEPTYRGTDDRRDLKRPAVDPPFDVVRYPKNLPDGARGIRLETNAIQLVDEGSLADTIPFSGVDSTLPEIAEAVGDEQWIAEADPGVFELRAALVQAPGTTLTIGGPDVDEIRLLDFPGVFLGGDGAELLIRDVTVTSWARDGSGPDTVHEDGRPFILYEHGARLDIVDAEIAYLGSDRASAYGVSWRLGRTEGRVIGSDFHHNFFGIYTYEAHGIVVRDSAFHHHVFYGVDPHDFSSNLLFEDNVAYANGSHGMIVSKGVTDSVFRHNRSFGNHGNGIVIDEASDRNHVVGNLVEQNKGDGIVLLGSGDNVVARNVVRGNRVGVRINNEGSVGNVVRNNVIEDNRVGVEAYRGAADLRLVDNVIQRNTETGMRLGAARTSVEGGTVFGGDTGIDLRSLVEVERVRIAGVDRGVRVAPGAVTALRALRIDASEVGVAIDDPAETDLRASSVDAATPVRGSLTFAEANVMSAAPFIRSWLPLVGMGVLLVAVSFEVLRSFRSRHQESPRAPAPVWNTA